MKRARKRILFAAVFGPVISLLTPGLLIAESVLQKSQDLRTCIEQQNQLDVLLLVDESSSLSRSNIEGEVGNDADDLRVPALGSVVRVLTAAVEASKSETAASSRTPLKVSVSLAGFGDGYSERLGFTPLSGSSLDQVLDEIRKQADRDNQRKTEYHRALDGSLKAFQALGESGSCRLLVWFSDGEHNSDGNTGLSTIEQQQIQDDICGPGKIVDQLRANRVYIVATGLNRNENQLGLMRLIAEGGQPYESLSACGETLPNGSFALAEQSDRLVDRLFKVLQAIPGIPQETNDVDLETCNSGESSCNEFSFRVDRSVASFTLLVSRPSDQVSVFVSSDVGLREDVTALDAGGESTSNSRNPALSVQTLNNLQYMLTAKSSQGTPIAGDWRIEFVGPKSESAKAIASFIGLTALELVDQSDQVLPRDGVKISRFKALDLNVRVDVGTPSSIIDGLDVNIRGPNNLSVKPEVRSGAEGRFVIPGSGLVKVLSQGELAKASSALLILTPQGEVPGLTTRQGNPVDIDFGTEVFKVVISNGESFPTLVRVDDEEVLFKGTPKKSVNVVFRGPDDGTGSVRFVDALEPAGGPKSRADFNLEVSECQIAQQTEQTCSVELLPNAATFDQFDLLLSVLYRSSDGSEIQGEIPVTIRTLKPTDAGRGLITAAELIAIFLVVQGLVRLALSFLLSKFAPLSATARRVRIDASVDSSGNISINPLNVNPSHLDDGFASENIESVNSFVVFGHEFRCPVIRTFLHSSSSPLGVVSSNERFVFGSRGHQPVKGSPLEARGQVELSLRGQWVVSIPTDQVLQLSKGSISADAEIIAFLEPYERIEREQQIMELGFTISSSDFGTHFSSVVARSQENPVDDETPEETDPFGAEPIQKPRKSKKQDRTDRGPGDETKIDTNPEWDPFA